MKKLLIFSSVLLLSSFMWAMERETPGEEKYDPYASIEEIIARGMAPEEPEVGASQEEAQEAEADEQKSHDLTELKDPQSYEKNFDKDTHYEYSLTSPTSLCSAWLKEYKRTQRQYEGFIRAQHACPRSALISRALKILKYQLEHKPESVSCFTKAQEVPADTLRELEILVNLKAENACSNIAQKINKTQTAVGYIDLCNHLAHFDKLENICARQKLVRNLTDNSEQLAKLSGLLKQLKKDEGKFVSFFTYEKSAKYSEDILADRVMHKKKFLGLIRSIYVPVLKCSADSRLPKWLVDVEEIDLNYNSLACEIDALVSFASSLPIHFIEGLYKIAKTIYNPTSLLLTSPDTLASTIQDSAEKLTASKAAGHAYSAFMTAKDVDPINLMYSAMDMAASISTYELIRERLRGVARFVRHLQEVQQILEELNFPKELTEKLTLQDDSNEDFTYLLNLLINDGYEKIETPVLNKLSEYPCFIWGKLILSYRLMLKYRYRLLDAYAALGHIDLLVSLARLLKEQNDQAPYCLANLDSSSAKPYICAKNIWNPFLDPERVVLNTIKLGAVPECIKKTRIAIVTGPNGYGKSTMLRNAGLAALLAQTLGIVPAQACTLTPMHILTAINIADSPAENISLFKAQVARMQKMRATAAASKDKAYLLLADEPYRSTAATEAAKSLYAYFKLIEKLENVLAVVTCHAEMVTDLEKKSPHVFANYTISQQRKFIPGVGSSGGEYTQNIRDILLQEHGEEFLHEFDNTQNNIS